MADVSFCTYLRCTRCNKKAAGIFSKCQLTFILTGRFSTNFSHICKSNTKFELLYFKGGPRVNIFRCQTFKFCAIFGTYVCQLWRPLKKEMGNLEARTPCASLFQVSIGKPGQYDIQQPTYFHEQFDQLTFTRAMSCLNIFY